MRWQERVQRTICLTCLVMGHFAARCSEAAIVRVSSRAELQQALERAGPGTEIRLAAGEYAGGISVREIAGTAEAPIVIRSADPDRPAVIAGGMSGLHFVRPMHVELRDLVVKNGSRNGINIDDGGDAARPARHVTLRNVRVLDVGPDGNSDGIKLSGLDDFTLDNCTVERWGRSGSAIDMVGCHRGQILGSEFRDGPQPNSNGVQTKGGSSDIAIRWCRFESAGGRAVNIGGSTGLPYFRPADAEAEARDITVADCTFTRSLAPIVCVGVDGAEVVHNTVYRPTKWVLRILQENTAPRLAACRNVRVAHNIIVYRADEARAPINIGPGTEPETFVFEQNHWYCLDAPTSRVRPPGKVSGEVQGTNPRLRDPERGDLALPAGSVLQSVGPRPRDAAGGK